MQCNDVTSEDCESVISYDVASRRYPVHFLLKEAGCYTGVIRYKQDVLPTGTFAIIALLGERWSCVGYMTRDVV